MSEREKAVLQDVRADQGSLGSPAPRQAHAAPSRGELRRPVEEAEEVILLFVASRADE